METVTRATLATSLSLVVAACGGAGEAPATAGTGAPAEASPWPEVQWPLPVDPALEKRIDALLATMTAGEKVGQLVQGDIASLTPEDVRKYRLDSVLAGADMRKLDAVLRLESAGSLRLSISRISLGALNEAARAVSCTR